MKTTVFLLGLAATMTFAAPPATRPASTLPPAVPVSRPEMTDPRQPAFVPKFDKADRTPAGHFAERDYARQYTYPGYIYSGYGYYSGGYYGGPGTWGSTQISFR